MWPWRSIHSVKLIKWMRKYNKKHNNILEFYGVDINYICKDYTIENEITIFIKEAQIKSMKLSGFDVETGTYKNTENEEYESDNFRDKSMFDIFMKICDDSKKYFILMHNGHIAKEPNHKKTINFGNYIYYYFKNNYFVIGNSFNGNSFLAVNYKKSAKQIFSLEVSDFKGEVDISKLKYVCLLLTKLNI